MSTAFMVDNILQDKDPDHINDSFTSASDSESEPTSDHKDSICCDSPMYEEDHHHHHHHINPNSQDTDELLQSYTVLRASTNQNDEMCDDEEDAINNENAMIEDDDDARMTDGGPQKLCCGKCGHLQFGVKTIIDNEIQYEFKCDKCGSCDYNYNIKVMGQNGNNKINATTTTTTTATNLLENNSSSKQPVLKFSVSAILGERKDCVKVRNGKSDVYSKVRT